MNRACSSSIVICLLLISGCTQRLDTRPGAASREQAATVVSPQPVSTANFVSLEIDTGSGWGGVRDFLVSKGSANAMGYDYRTNTKTVLRSVALSQAVSFKVRSL